MIVNSFSGGRSSAVMTFLLYDTNPREDLITIFCNTGKEHPATLDFVQACSEAWRIPIVWLEYAGKKAYREVDWASASRNGEPFEQLITDRSYLPNMVARFCTSELKVLTMERYLADQGIEDYDMAVGIRGDEPRRLAKMRAKQNYITPLAEYTSEDIHDFWQEMPFDLQLPDQEHNLWSNCDLCFLKGGKIKASLIQSNPGIADWWVAQEQRIGGLFRSDQPSYTDLQVIARDQDDIFGYDDESIACFCGD